MRRLLLTAAILLTACEERARRLPGPVVMTDTLLINAFGDAAGGIDVASSAGGYLIDTEVTSADGRAALLAVAGGEITAYYDGSSGAIAESHTVSGDGTHIARLSRLYPLPEPRTFQIQLTGLTAGDSGDVVVGGCVPRNFTWAQPSLDFTVYRHCLQSDGLANITARVGPEYAPEKWAVAHDVTPDGMVSLALTTSFGMASLTVDLHDPPGPAESAYVNAQLHRRGSYVTRAIAQTVQGTASTIVLQVPPVDADEMTVYVSYYAPSRSLISGIREAVGSTATLELARLPPELDSGAVNWVVDRPRVSWTVSQPGIADALHVGIYVYGSTPRTWILHASPEALTAGFLDPPPMPQWIADAFVPDGTLSFCVRTEERDHVEGVDDLWEAGGVGSPIVYQEVLSLSEGDRSDLCWW